MTPAAAVNVPPWVLIVRPVMYSVASAATKGRTPVGTQPRRTPPVVEGVRRGPAAVERLSRCVGAT
jgi:hypothetical protein